MKKSKIREHIWAAGAGNVAFYPFDGVAFTRDRTPVLFKITSRKIPLSVRRRCEGMNIKLVELNTASDWVTVY